MAKHMSVQHAIQVAQRAQARDMRHRHRVRAFEHALIRKSAVAISAGAFGAMTRQGVPNSIGAFPWKLGLWVGATLVEALAGSATVSHFAGGVSDATMAVYMANSIGNKTWIAGEGDEYEYEEGVEGEEGGELAA